MAMVLLIFLFQGQLMFETFRKVSIVAVKRSLVKNQDKLAKPITIAHPTFLEFLHNAAVPIVTLRNAAISFTLTLNIRIT
jgi:hypothetical protein